LALFVPLCAAAQPYVYVANLGSNDISVIDTRAHTIVATLPAGEDPDGAAVSIDGKRVYIANFLSDDVTVIDASTQTVVETIPVGAGPVGIAVSPDGTRAYTANREEDTVSVIDTQSLAVTETVAVGRGPNAAAITPDGGRVFVTNSRTKFPGTVSIIDRLALPTGTTEIESVKTVPVQRNPNRVAVAPSGAETFVTNFRSWNVSVLDSSTNEPITTIRFSGRPSGVAVNPNGVFVYVSTLNGNVQVIDTATYLVHATIPVGGEPYGLGITRNGAMGYVANFADDTVSVLDLTAHTSAGTIGVGEAPFAVVANCVDDGCNEVPLTPAPTNTWTPSMTPSLTPTITPTPTLTHTPPANGEEVLVRAGSTTVRPGDIALLQITLETNGNLPARVENLLRIQPPVYFRSASGSIDCVRNATIGKNRTVFVGQPARCSPRSCEALRVTVDASDNTEPIDDGSLLYSCRVDVPFDAPQGTYLIEVLAASSTDPEGSNLPTLGRNGAIIVDGPPRPTPTRLPTSTRQPTETPRPPTPTPVPDGFIRVSDAEVRPGDEFEIEIKLVTKRSDIVATENVIVLDRGLEFAEDSPRTCRANPLIDKDGTIFSLRPFGGSSCRGCSSVKVIVIDFTHLSPIAPGSLLYTCRLRVSADTAIDTYAVQIVETGGSDNQGEPIPLAGAAGTVTVSGAAGADTRGATAPPTSRCSGGSLDGSPCESDASCPAGVCVNVAGMCSAGDDDGLLCDCPLGACRTGSCQGGIRPGATCRSSSNCAGDATCEAATRVCASGISKGSPCTSDRHCLASRCVQSGSRCAAGDFDRFACVDHSDCPFGRCLVVTTSTATPRSEAPPTPTQPVTTTTHTPTRAAPPTHTPTRAAPPTHTPTVVERDTPEPPPSPTRVPAGSPNPGDDDGCTISPNRSGSTWTVLLLLVPALLWPIRGRTRLGR
jgi:YVTN family beta-propeller protein